MPLSMAAIGEEHTIKSLHGKEETIHHVESLGFVVGSKIAVVAKNGGNLIVSIKGSRIALSLSMANKIYV